MIGFAGRFWVAYLLSAWTGSLQTAETSRVRFRDGVSGRLVRENLRPRDSADPHAAYGLYSAEASF